MRSYFAIPALGTILLIAACEARQTTPVAMAQPGDAELTCVQIAAEIKANEAKAIEFAGADKDLVSNNVAGASWARSFGQCSWRPILANPSRYNSGRCETATPISSASTGNRPVRRPADLPFQGNDARRVEETVAKKN
ncbi:MAG: hypothetical protein OEN23_00595 [Paracoccaceae bacterium]|nr:hypothetical protein [Paracoccaceae bacterium]